MDYTLKAYCDSDRCGERRIGRFKGRPHRWARMTDKMIEKPNAKRDAKFCSDCGAALFWIRKDKK